jgi:PAS domain S-box-containing protein
MVRPVAWAGINDGYVDNLRITLEDPARGDGPAGQCIRTEQPVEVGDIRSDPRMEPWREAALARGFLSILNLPVINNKQVIGVIVAYSGEVDAFNEEETALLFELSGNLAYGITAMRDRAKRLHAEEELRRSRDELEERVRERTTELQVKHEELEIQSEELETQMEELRANNEELQRINVECQRAEDELRISEERLTLSMEAGQSGSFDWDATTDVNTWSDEILSLYGLKREEFKGTMDAWYDCLVPEDRQAGVQTIKRSMETGDYNFEFRIRRRDNGEVRWMHGRGKVYRDAGGKPLRMLGINVDITDSKRAEKSIREQAELIDLSPDAIIVRDLGGHIAFWSRGAETTYGFSRSEALGKISHTLLKTVFQEPLSNINEKLRETGRWTGELVHTTKDGRQVTVQSSWLAQQDGDNIKEILESNVDITEQKQAEKALRESEARLKVAEAIEVERRRFYDILENLPVMVCLLTPDYHVPFGNRAYREKFGELDGGHCYEYCFEKSEPCDFCEAFSVFKTGQSHHFELQSPDGTVIDVYDYPFTDVDGSPLILEMCIDITDRKRAEVELEKYRKHLEDLVKERTRDLENAKFQAELYLDLMGHDISNMHQIAMGQLQLAQEVMAEDGKLEGDEKEFVDTSLQTLERSAKLIDNVRKLQQMETGQYKSEPVDIGELLSDVVAMYSDTGIKVDTVREGGRAFYRVAVEDNGPGVPDEKKDMIFHRLKRGQTTTRGTGLELYIVKTLVESFHGRVALEDRVPGDHRKGSRFLVYLPVAEDKNAE